MKKYFSATHWFAIVGFSFLLFISCDKIDVLDDLPKKGSSSSGKTERAKADVANDWYQLQCLIMLERNSAFNGVYYGYIGVGLYESVRPGIKGGKSFYGRLRTMPKMPEPENNDGYDFVICANTALADMTRSFFSGLTPANLKAIDDLEKKYNSQSQMQSQVFKRSQAFGKAIAKAIFNWYQTDDLILSNAGYIVPTGPGLWVPTPPAFLPIPINTFFGKATTWLPALNNVSCKPFPYTYSEVPGSNYYKMVKEVYDQSKINTTDQKNIAFHWVDQGNGVGYTPPGHDFYVLQQGIVQAGVTLDVAAEAYAKAGIGERDGSIVVFRAKYIYNVIRPVSYIKSVIDPAWNPLFGTPPHPEYPAAHAGVTGSALLSAQSVLGKIPIEDHAYDFRNFPVQYYPSLFAAAQQAGTSRFYGGIHYVLSIDEGIDVAKIVAKEVGGIRVRD